MVEIDDASMSTLGPSIPRLPARTTDVASLLDSFQTAVRGAAFWASIPLPLVIVALLLSGTATAAPLVLVGLVVLNACCAAVGHAYTPAR